MPKYKYKAKDADGKDVKGIITAPDQDNLTSQLKEMDQYLISYSVVQTNSSIKLTSPELADFNRQLGSMLSAGITLFRALEIIMKRDISPKHKAVYEELYVSLLAGNSMSDAMEEQGKVFPKMLINMYRSAEANGTIDQTATRMADHYMKEYQLQSKIKSAMTYPCVLLVLTLAIVVLVFTLILPNFTALYTDDMELPAITQVVLSISDLFTKHWLYLIIGVVLAVAIFRFLLSIDKIRLAFDRFKLKAPIIGKMMRIVCTARFSRTLSSLYASGLSILTTIQIAKGTLGNAYIAAQFETLLDDLRTGNSLADSIAKIDGFDKKLSSIISVGEESGQLEYMLDSVADSFDYEASEATGRMLTIIEPLMIVVMAGVVGVVIVAVMMPMYSMYGNMGL